MSREFKRVPRRVVGLFFQHPPMRKGLDEPGGPWVACLCGLLDVFEKSVHFQAQAIGLLRQGLRGAVDLG